MLTETASDILPASPALQAVLDTGCWYRCRTYQGVCVINLHASVEALLVKLVSAAKTAEPIEKCHFIANTIELSVLDDKLTFAIYTLATCSKLLLIGFSNHFRNDLLNTAEVTPLLFHQKSRHHPIRRSG